MTTEVRPGWQEVVEITTQLRLASPPPTVSKTAPLASSRNKSLKLPTEELALNEVADQIKYPARPKRNEYSR